MIEKIKKVIMGSLIALNLASPLSAVKPYLKSTIYYDSRKSPTINFTGGIAQLPLNTNLFGFIDFYSKFGKDYNTLDQGFGKLTLTTKEKLGPVMEYSKDLGFGNGQTRFGISYQPDIKGFFCNLKALPFTTNGSGTQLSGYAKKSFGKYLVEGFIDYNSDSKKVVSEVQVGKKIANDLSIVVEGRYNGYKKGNEKGIAIGLEKLIK